MWRRGCRRRCQKNDGTVNLCSFSPQAGRWNGNGSPVYVSDVAAVGCVATCVAPTKARASRLPPLPQKPRASRLEQPSALERRRCYTATAGLRQQLSFSPRGGEKGRECVSGLRFGYRGGGCVATCVAPTKVRASRFALLLQRQEHRGCRRAHRRRQRYTASPASFICCSRRVLRLTSSLSWRASSSR